MRRLSIALIAAASTIAFMQMASAADLPVKAPRYAPPPPSPPYSWSGFYVGLNAGYGGDASHIDISAFGSGNGTGPAHEAANTNAIPTYLKTDPQGFLGGFQLGYNWHLMPQWLVGLEADINFADVRGSNTRIGTASAVAKNTFSAVATILAKQKMNWFGTLRPRAGFLVTNNFLIYATGGLAFGHVSSSTDLTETTACTVVTLCPYTNTGRGSASSTRAGWAVGGGTEWAVNSHWSLKAEYLYVDLGDLTYANSPLTNGQGVSIVNTTSVAHFKNNIVRLGLNYKF